MSNKYRIILKFTQNDNIPLSGEDNGWVDYFAEILKASIRYRIKSPLEIVFKNETELITANDFEDSNLIIYILSPAFIFSSNINQDASILEAAFNFDIPYINQKVKKVFKAPVKIEDLPLSLSTPTYYRFYDITSADDIEYKTYEGWNEYQENDQYWEIMADLLGDVFRILMTEDSESDFKVFISNNSQEYFQHRNSIKRELKAHKTKIYPDEDFSIEANYMEDSELFFMKKCNISLHFPDEFMNLNSKQREGAFDKLTEQNRYIWFSPQEALKPEKKAKYNELKVQLKPYKNIEAIESPIEELKSILKEKLFAKPNQHTAEFETSKEIIYIVSDISLTDTFKKSLDEDNVLKEKFEIKFLSNVQKVSDYRMLHYELLKTADYFFILHFNSNIEWLKSMVSEIRKAPGFNRNKAVKGKFILAKQHSLPNNYVAENFRIITVFQPEEIVDHIKEIL